MTTEQATAPSPLQDRYDARTGEVHLSGLHALVRLPLDQVRLDRARGLDTGVFVSGYEGSPLAGLDLQLHRQSPLLAEHGVVFKPGVNEELAASAVQGSQIASASPERIGDGVVGIWYGKAPGLDRATDAIRHGNLSGTDRRGGVLALVGDDSTAKSSTVPSSSEAAIAELGMPCLVPADPGEVLDYGLHGIALSRTSGLWVALKLATNVVDGSGTVHLDPTRVEPTEPDRTFDGTEFEHEVTGHLLQPVLGRLERSQSRERLEVARRYAAANRLNTIIGDPTATLGLACAGAVYLEVRQALAEMGITEQTLRESGVRILKLAMVHPLEPGIVAEFAEGLSEVLVVEEKKAFIELALKDLLYGQAGAPRVLGKRDQEGSELFRADGDLPADYIAARLGPRIRDHGGPASVAAWLEAQSRARRVPTLLPILPRTPYFCSGCPHNSSTRVPDGALVGGGIGCHAMIAMLPEERSGETIGLAAMGVEGSAWIGMSPFVTRDHLFQNIGDGTFHHSGSLAVRNAVASGAHMTFKLLYNDTVAMTGGQAPVGKMTVPQIVTELLAEGVRRIVITTDDPQASRRAFGRGRLPRNASIRHRDDIIDVQDELAKIDGVTVLIHEQECATELRRKRKRGLVETPDRRILINERICEGCGDCGDKSNCLSVQPVDTEFGRKTQIHQGSCNLDFSCIKGDCPSFVEVVPATGQKPRSDRTGRPAPASSAVGRAVDPDSLPTPQVHVSDLDFTMRITGVGGTGVVTVAQVLAAAAARAGLNCVGLDQLGLAQKGGAVVSDVRLSSAEIIGSNKIGPGACDLYLGCDVLVAAAQANLAVIDPERTYAVVSTSASPTGGMITDPTVTFPETQVLVDRIEWGGRRPENVFVDVRDEIGTILADDAYANVFLLGVAVQAGVLPISPADIEWALDLNGVQVERNLLAFRLGRSYVAQGASSGAGSDDAPSKTARLVQEIAGVVHSAEGSALASAVAIRVEELIAYQSARYARRYVAEVELVRAAEESALGSPSGEIAEEYARQLFKVMAYKDEYEVARLGIDAAFTAQVEEQFGAGARHSYLLHPPILKALGLKRKIRLRGWWARPALRILYRLRGLRGTRLDVFGYAKVRREERALIVDYVRAMREATARLTAHNADQVRVLAGLPEWVRGYEEIKLHSLETYYARRAELSQLLAGQ
ncbi:MAG: 2-oxoacid ferredoxin oxidoreductase [Nocardioides sp.]|nr:2-oxoacid ferredoxin oxidoreductase [Nocardioides sp.]